MNFAAVKQFFLHLSWKTVLPVLLILFAGLLVIKLLLKLFDRALEHSRLQRTTFAFLRSMMRILLYFLLVLILFSQLGVDVTSLIAVLSVVSLAISLAVQNALSNVVGSVSLLSTHPFQVGDYVELGSDAGTVAEIGMVYTVLDTADNRRIYIPNSDAAAARICNYSANPVRRLDLTFSASYDDDPEKVKETLLSLAAQAELDGTHPPEAHVTAYGDSAITYLLRVWVAQEHYWDTLYFLNDGMKAAFDRAGIEMTYPHLNVHIDRAAAGQENRGKS